MTPTQFLLGARRNKRASISLVLAAAPACTLALLASVIAYMPSPILGLGLGFCSAALLMMNTPRTRLRWGFAETRGLIAARAEVEAEAEAEKCKWNSLVHPCRGKETSDPENVDELHAVFTEPAMNMRRPHPDVESGASRQKKKLKRPFEDRSFDELLDDDGDRDEDEDEEENSNRDGPARSTKTRVARGEKLLIGDRSIVDMLGELMEWQQKAERRWREEMERRAEERRVFEQEWREKMERLERERLMLERAMREREEQVRMREETRAEKRDALLNTLLNKLIQDGV